jgi:hypothetical protein
MSQAGWPLQKTIYAALAADTGLVALIGDPPRLYDDAPGASDLPAVQIGDGLESDWSTQTDAGAEHDLTIHVWSRAGGRKEARMILARIAGVLHVANLTLEDNTLINLRFVSSQVFREGDGETYHGVARYRAVTEET